MSSAGMWSGWDTVLYPSILCSASPVLQPLSRQKRKAMREARASHWENITLRDPDHGSQP